MKSSKGLLRTVLLATSGMILSLLMVSAGTTQEAEVGEALQKMLSQAKGQVDSISVEEFADMVENGRKFTLVDIRTEAEYNSGHLHGAHWVPRGKMEFLAAGGTIGSTDDEIILYCKRHGRSLLCAAILRQLGFSNVKYLTGGFESWVAAGYTIYNQHGELTVKAFEKSEE